MHDVLAHNHVGDAPALTASLQGFGDFAHRPGQHVRAVSQDLHRGFHFFGKTLQGGFAITNLTLLAPKLVRDVEFSASVYNLFDRRYFDPAGNDQNPVDRIEQNGRNFRLKMTYRF